MRLIGVESIKKRIVEYCGIGDVIDTEQTIEPRHGKWVFLYPTNENHYECSECGDKVYGRENYLTKYCPNCGARMDKE